jgi:hypothetical protein
VAEVRHHWQGIIGGALVIAALAAVRWALSAALPHVTPYLPPLIVRWLAPNRLAALAVVALLFLAQYLAWRKLRIQLDGKPYFDRDIGYGPARERPTGMPPVWPHGVVAEIEIKRDQKEEREIRVYANVPVRRISGSIDGKDVPCEMVGQDCAVFRPAGRLPKGAVLRVFLMTKEPARLARVYLVKAGSDEEY